MSIVKLIGATILTIIAIWFFLASTDPNAKLIGSIIIATIGIVLLITTFRKRG